MSLGGGSKNSCHMRTTVALTLAPRLHCMPSLHSPWTMPSLSLSHSPATASMRNHTCTLLLLPDSPTLCLFSFFRQITETQRDPTHGMHSFFSPDSQKGAHIEWLCKYKMTRCWPSEILHPSQFVFLTYGQSRLVKAKLHKTVFWALGTAKHTLFDFTFWQSTPTGTDSIQLGLIGCNTQSITIICLLQLWLGHHVSPS